MIVAVLIAGGAGFFGGMKYQQSKRVLFNGQFGGMERGAFRNQMQNGGSRMAFRPVNGEIISIDEKSVTVKLQDGSSKIIILSETTNINKAETAEKKDLTVGTAIAVFGEVNSDGSITAQNIQLNPILQRGINTDTQ